MRKISKSNWIAIAVAVLIYIYSFFTTKMYFNFSYNEFDTFSLMRYLFIRGTFIILDFALVFYIKNKICLLRKKDKNTTRLILLFIIAFAINMFFLLLTWPGNWINDEAGVLYNAKTFSYYSWQNYLTVIYYSLCLMIFPSAVSIPILQIIIISYSFAYFWNYVYEKTNNKWSWLLILVLFLPPVIYNNMYPLRISIYTFIEIAFLTWIYSKYKKNEILNIKDCMSIAIIIFILAFWRTEGIYYIGLPIIIYFLFKKTKNILLKCIAIELIACIFLGTFIYMDKKVDYEAYIKYKTTAIINPLSIILQNNLQNNQNEINKIDQVIDIELLKENPSYWNILIALDESKGLYRDNIVENYDGVMKAYFFIILNNIPEFLSERLEVYRITNGKYETETNYYSLNGISNFDEENKNIIKNDIFGMPINNNLRNKVLKILRAEDLPIIKIFWNVTPVLTGLCVLLIIFIINRKIVESLIICDIILRAILVFLTTPASFFMYYYPLYIEGLLLITVEITVLIKKIASHKFIRE